MQKVRISIVTPVYAGRDYLSDLLQEVLKLKTSLDAEGAPMEILEMIFVDDASSDGSIDVLRELAAEHDWVRLVELSRNFGQHPATIAGILHSSGDWVATIDEDLQHHPMYLMGMLKEAVMNQCDITFASPQTAVHDSKFRDWSSKLYKRILARLTGISHIKAFNSFRMIRGTVARATASVCGHETYFDIALCWFSNRIRSMELPLKDMRFIQTKRSGYNLFKLLSHARRLIMSSQTNVLRFGLLVGALAVAMAVVALALAIHHKLYAPNPEEAAGWASLFVGIAFFGGVSVFLTGVLIEYMKTLVLHTQGKPTFFAIDRSLDGQLVNYFKSH